MMKKIVILGSTGSIGTQALDVIRQNPDKFKAACLSCGRNVDLLRKQLEEFQPESAVCQREDDAVALRSEFPTIHFYSGAEGIIRAATSECDLVLNALTGIRGLVPTYQAIVTGHDVALANKETLVAGGHIIMKAAEENGVEILPVDSEHNAIFQCLKGNDRKDIKRILLTASGGPFRGYDLAALENVTPEQALKHPNWSMGKKVTIDSATMMNKGLEMIEAKWLFHVDIDQIQVLVHPQSILHSAVEFCDNSIIAQLGEADMRIPISVALCYPDRVPVAREGLDFFNEASRLTFEKPDTGVFRCLEIAANVSKAGGGYPAAMNAANEALVQAFLDKKIGFLDIQRGIEKILDGDIPAKEPTLVETLHIDREVRERVEKDLL